MLKTDKFKTFLLLIIITLICYPQSDLLSLYSHSLIEAKTKDFTNKSSSEKENLSLKLSKAYLNKEYINSFDISYDRKYFALASNRFIRIYDIKKTNLHLFRKIALNTYITDIKFHPSERIIAFAKVDGEVGTLNLDTEYFKSMTKHKKKVNIIEYSDDGRYLISGSDDMKVIRWDTHNNSTEVLYSHKNIISSLSHKSKSEVVSCSFDGTIALYQINKEKRSEFNPWVYFFTKYPDSNRKEFHRWLTSVIVENKNVISSGWSRKLYKLSTEKGKMDFLFSNIKIPITYITKSNNSEKLFVSDIEGNIYTVNISDLNITSQINFNNSKITKMLFVKLNDDNSYLITSHENGNLFFFNYKS